jgi:Flp pilus assembly protein TadG
VFPIVILVLTGGIDLARAVYAYNTIGNAAREGARVAAVNQILVSPDCDESRPVEDPLNPHWSVQTCAAAAAVTLGVAPTDVTVAFSVPPAPTALKECSTVQVGCIASVTVHYVYQPITPVLNLLVPSMTMDSTSQMPVERVFP